MSTAGPDINQLVDPDAHERLTATRWEPERARAAVASIATRTEEAFDPDELWPPHPLDQEPDAPPLRRLASLYLGAAGVIWALHALTRAGLTEPGRDWAPVAATLSERYLLTPDFEDVGAVPSLWRGEAGILLVAHTLAPAAWQEERLLDVVCANVDHPSRELMWGSPGTMLASQEMLARTGDERWRSAWADAADRLWDAWGDDVWEQDLYGRRVHILGPAHGFAGIVHALAHGGLLDADRSRALAPRAASALGKHPCVSKGSSSGGPRWNELCAATYAVVPRRAGQRGHARLARARKRRTHRAPRRGWRAHLEGGAARQGRRSLSRNGGQRLRLPRALRADRGRALARPRASVRDARAGAGRASDRTRRPRSPHAVDRRSRHGALPRELHRRAAGLPDDRPVVTGAGYRRPGGTSRSRATSASISARVCNTARRRLAGGS